MKLFQYWFGASWWLHVGNMLGMIGLLVLFQMAPYRQFWSGLFTGMFVTYGISLLALYLTRRQAAALGVDLSELDRL